MNPSPFRSRFRLPDDAIYLDGNSLGPVCVDAEQALLGALDAWREHQIEGWTDGDAPWLFLAERLGARLAPLVGAEPGEVVACGSTTVNLHQLLATLYPGDGAIVMDASAFPSDRCAVESHLRLRGRDPRRWLRTVAARTDGLLAEEDVAAALGAGDVTLAVLPAVVYTTGQLLDVAGLTREARARGVVVLWDCAHSIGAVPHALSAWGADAAFWCHYKWCNAGPGAVGGLYLNRRHHGRAPGLAGWFGARKETMFDAGAPFAPAGDAGALQIGTTHVLSLAPLDGALRPIEEAGIGWIRERSLALTAMLRERAEAALGPYGVRVATPREDARRGGHVALRHPEAGALCRALRRERVIPDHRPPDTIRLAPAALYTDPHEVDAAVERLREILATGSWRTAEPAGLVP